MVRKAKARQPVRHVQACQVCDGSGRTLDEDYDPEYGARIVPVPCEGCDGTGWLADCAICDEPMPLTEAEQNGYRCTACVVAAEVGDAEAEMSRIRRLVS